MSKHENVTMGPFVSGVIEVQCKSHISRLPTAVIEISRSGRALFDKCFLANDNKARW